MPINHITDNTPFSTGVETPHAVLMGVHEYEKVPGKIKPQYKGTMTFWLPRPGREEDDICVFCGLSNGKKGKYRTKTKQCWYCYKK